MTPSTLDGRGRSASGDVLMSDFGVSTFTSEARKICHTPILLQAPEALLGESMGQPTDIWAFACTVFEIFNNISLFEVGMPSADDVLSEIVDCLGRLPEPWWKKWEYRAEYYEEDGTKKTDNLVKEYH